MLGYVQLAGLLIVTCPNMTLVWCFSLHPMGHCLYICKAKDRGKESHPEPYNNGRVESSEVGDLYAWGLRYVHTLVFFVTTWRQLFLFPG